MTDRQSERLPCTADAEAISARGWRTAISRRRSGGETSAPRAGTGCAKRRNARDAGRRSDRRTVAGEPFALRFRVRANRAHGALQGRRIREQSKSHRRYRGFRRCCRSDGCPPITWPPARTDADLRISHIIRGRSILPTRSSTCCDLRGRRVSDPPPSRTSRCWWRRRDQALQALRHARCQRDHLSRRRFLPHAFVNFLCCWDWSPKDDREQMPRQDLIDGFLAGIKPQQRGGEFHRGRPVRSQGRVAERRDHSQYAGGATHRGTAAGGARAVSR